MGPCLYSIARLKKKKKTRDYPRMTWIELFTQKYLFSVLIYV
ncbi:hypothetical protein KUCAC02_006863 [Chaenocephalus aceratus]|uniref:Uncharacterized protein n=1 Tax=Chaenocephalus aceratus TaxID=36190 RepID=A0ACB9VSZ3_CHAAC|nr:hypothetical protein KUCAC02_006863 [Chaenocephalus aceratus]